MKDSIAYGQGFRARLRGEGIESNPYTDLDWRAEWSRGWEESEAFCQQVGLTRPPKENSLR